MVVGLFSLLSSNVSKCSNEFSFKLVFAGCNKIIFNIIIFRNTVRMIRFLIDYSYTIDFNYNFPSSFFCFVQTLMTRNSESFLFVEIILMLGF